MNPFVTSIEDILHQCIHDTYVRNLISTIEAEQFHGERIYLSLHDCSHLRYCEYNQTSNYIFDQYTSYAIDHIQLFRDSCEENGNPIKKDWSNIDCKQFDNSSESLVFETASAIIQRSFSYTSTSSSYNINRKDLWDFLESLRTYFNKV